MMLTFHDLRKQNGIHPAAPGAPRPQMGVRLEFYSYRLAA